MLKLNGNIWYFNKHGFLIVIPTNGSIKANGKAVMGRGLADQAVVRYPKLPELLGIMLNKRGNVPFVFPKYNIITFPVKHVWRKTANLELIRNSAHGLVDLVDRHELEPPFYLPKVGCGNGRRDWDTEVRPILKDILDDRFVVINLVERQQQ